MNISREDHFKRINSEKQIEQAIKKFKAINWDGVKDWEYEKEKLETFLNNCLMIVKEEGEVEILFA